ncbi:MAG: UPF0164 family protein [Candidatus Krumholzibacteriota bacterium]|nr:UPF0164 family protein [Candidatus Krumholzibacteriota bacterium]
MKQPAILALSLLLLAAAAAAQEPAAGQPGAFLRFGAGARGLAMGGAGAGLADDAGALYANPAGLDQVRSPELLLFHANLLEDTHYGFLGLVYPLGRLGTLGVSGVILQSDGYERATLTDDLGETFADSRNALQLTLARRAGPVSVGVTYRHVNQSLAGYSGGGDGLDLSLFSRPLRSLSVGLSLQNLLAPRVTLYQDEERYPLTLRAGLAVHLAGGRLLPVLDLVRVGDAPTILQAGCEYWSFGRVALRAGWDTGLNRYAAGGGYRHGPWQFDYAVADTPIGLSHRLSLTWRFGRTPQGVSMQASTARFSPSGELNKVDLQLESGLRGRAQGWELVIYTPAGEPCHSARGSKEPPAVYSWDGRDDRGRLVPTGRYRVMIIVLDEFGDPWTQETVVEIRDYDPDLKTPVRMEMH